MGLLLVLSLPGCMYLETHEDGNDTSYKPPQEKNATYEYVSDQPGDPPIYRGLKAGKLRFPGSASGQEAYARGVYDISGNNHGYYGAAFYFPPGTFTGSSPAQTGRIDIMGWAHTSSGESGGISIFPDDHKARLVRDDGPGPQPGPEQIGSEFSLREGCWNWLSVRQKVSTEPDGAINEVYLNGVKLVETREPNFFGKYPDKARFGFVNIDTERQTGPLEMRMDDAYVSDNWLVDNHLAPGCKPFPNVVFIVTDDQRAGTVGDLDPNNDFDGNGTADDDYWMPQTWKWFKNGDAEGGVVGGTEFSQAFATTPTCCPSRASIFTGRYAHNHGVEQTLEPTKEPPNDARAICDDQPYTLQSYLQESGYHTAIFGKYLNKWVLGPGPPPYDGPGLTCNADGSQKGVPPYFDEWGIFDGNYNWWTRINSSVPEENETCDAVPDPDHPRPCIKNYNGETYSTHYVKNKALEFIRSRESDDDATPWFLYLAPYAPHAQGLPENGYRPMTAPNGAPTAYDGIEVPEFRSMLGDSYNEIDRSDKPRWVREWSDNGQIFDAPDPSWPEGVRPGLRSQQLRTLKGVDDLVESVFKALEDAGEADDTLAVFVSDNGHMWREHGTEPTDCGENGTPLSGCGLSSKSQPYLESIQVPLFMRWPRNPLLVARGATDDRLVANIDLAPTVLDAIDVSPGTVPGAPPMDGRSLLDPYRRDRILTEHFDLPRLSIWGSLVTPAYQYTFYEDDPVTDGPPDPFTEYYAFDFPFSDRAELNNLYPATGLNDPDELATQLQEDRTCKGHGELLPTYPACP